MTIQDADYRIKTRYVDTVFNQPFHNVWYWKRATGLGAAPELFAAFFADIWTAMEEILPFSTINTGTASILVENLLDPDDFYVDNSAVLEGNFASSDVLPRFNCASFTIFRGSRLQRHHGRKAIGPIVEGAQVNGQPTAGYLTILNTFAAAMEAGCDNGGSHFDLCVPYSLKVADETYKSGFRYDLETLYPNNGVSFRRLSTQNSRKGY